MGAIDIKMSQAARTKMVTGVEALANIAAVTYGPNGRQVLVDRDNRAPIGTRDGLAASSDMELVCKFENAGVQLVKQAAAEVGNATGDGTTTTILLTRALVREGMKMVAAGFSPLGLRRGIEGAASSVAETLQEQSRPCAGADLQAVATSAAGGDTEIGEMVAAAIRAVGAQGAVTIEPGRGMSSQLEIVDGLRFAAGYISPSFINDRRRQRCTLTDPLVLVCGDTLSDGRALIPLLESVARAGRALFVIAGDIVGEALSLLTVNSLRGTLKVCAVRAPEANDRRTDFLEDLAAITGTHVVSAQAGVGIDTLGPDQLGSARRIEVGGASTTMIGAAGNAERIKVRSGHIEQRIAAQVSDFDVMVLKERLGRMRGRAAVIRIGGVSDIELNLNRMRVEKALHATRAAAAEGLLPGGGVALLRAAQRLQQSGTDPNDEAAGRNVLRRALEEPLRHLAANSGADPSATVARVAQEQGSFGFDARDRSFGDLDRLGIADPAVVTRRSLQIAASTAALILTNEAMVVQAPRAIRIHAHDAQVCGCGCGDR